MLGYPSIPQGFNFSGEGGGKGGERLEKDKWEKEKKKASPANEI